MLTLYSIRAYAQNGANIKHQVALVTTSSTKSVADQRDAVRLDAVEVLRRVAPQDNWRIASIYRVCETPDQVRMVVT